MLARAFALALVQCHILPTYGTVMQGRIKHDPVLQKFTRLETAGACTRIFMPGSPGHRSRCFVKSLDCDLALAILIPVNIPTGSAWRQEGSDTPGAGARQYRLLTGIKCAGLVRSRIRTVMAENRFPPLAQDISNAREAVARWEHYPHEADMGVRGFGTTKAEAFE